MSNRNLLAYVYVPVLQKELDTFRITVWNHHRGRKQKNKDLPAGIPEHIYQFPEKYGAEKCGIPVTDQQLAEVAQLSGVEDMEDDFLEEDFRKECERHIADTDDIEASEAANAYLFLKANFDENSIL